MAGRPGATRAVRAGLHRVRLPLIAPHRAAHGTEDRREVVLVHIDDDAGRRGWGECPTLARPGYGDEWTDGAWAALRDDLLPALVAGRDLPPAGPMASGAVRDALLDLALRGEGRALDPPATGPRQRSVAFGVAVGLADDVGVVVAAAERAVAAGAASVVVKVRPGWSVAPVSAVRSALPAGVAVAADANGSFGPADLEELRRLDEWDLAFLEQPAAPRDLEASAVVAAALSTPVALDESIVTARDLAAAISVEAGSVLTVKPARLGGVAAATVAADRARTAGWEVHVGGMLESGVGRAAARLLAARAEVATPSLVGPTSLLFADDVVDPVEAGDDGRVPVHAGEGLAPGPVAERLRRLTVDRWETVAPR